MKMHPVMKILKYIINEKKIPILFSTDITHNEVMQNGLSAGFLIINYDLQVNKFIVKCFGESTSLKIKNCHDDQYIIENYLNHQFFTIIDCVYPQLNQKAV